MCVCMCVLQCGDWEEGREENRGERVTRWGRREGGREERQETVLHRGGQS